MVEVSPPTGPEAERAACTLAALQREAASVRAQLLALQGDLAQVQGHFDAARATQLLEANEQLVLAALRAESIADTASGKLDELRTSAQRDALTGTPNRALMLDRMTLALGMARRRSSRLALLFIDLNGFKQLNDVHGHATGDAALQAVARLLQSSVRETDTVSRHGGDEFLVLLPEISQAGDAALIAQKMLDTLAAAPLQAGGRRLSLSASIGIAIYPDDGENLPSLVAKADAAMYSVKREGRHAYRFHVAGMPDPADAAPPQLHDLREANAQLVVAALAAQATELDAEQAHCRQLDFLRRLAQQLRQPLAPIQAAVARLDSVRADPVHSTQLQTGIQHHLEHLARLVQDLLSGIHAGSGAFRIDRGAVDQAAVHVWRTPLEHRPGPGARLRRRAWR